MTGCQNDAQFGQEPAGLCLFRRSGFPFLGLGKQNTNRIRRSGLGACAPDLGEETICTRQELKEIAHNLAVLSVNRVRGFYERAYAERWILCT